MMNLSDYKELIDKRLSEILSTEEIGDSIVSKAMRYSVENGGKRVRPILTLEFCRICNGDVSGALDLACAVELIHTYSLIHDDLPCMDNDDFRRGKPSCHKEFGEEYALLAGDALLTLAFKIAAKSNKIDAVEILSEYAGINGMIGGQTIDLCNENKSVGLDELTEMDNLKTGKLISAACVLGCIAADADENKINAAKTYAENIGLAFQIKDDILDITSTEDVLGKPIGSDTENNKSTYVSLLGIDRSKEIVDELTMKAIDSLKVFEKESENLIDFAKELAKRNN